MRFITLLFFSILISCSKPDHGILEIDVSENFLELELSRIGKSSKIIRLKTSEPINNPTDILITQSNIFLFDQNHSGILRKFDSNGNLLKKVGFYGDKMIPIDGITNFFVHLDTLYIAVNGESIYSFDYDLNLNFSKKLPFKAGFILKIGENYLMYNNRLTPEIPFRIFSIDSNEILKTSISENKSNYNPYFKAYSPFASQKGRTFTSFPFNDTIYIDFNEFNFVPFAKLNFGNRKFPDDFFEKVENGRQFYEKLSSSDAISLHEGMHFAKGDLLIATVLHSLYNYPIVVDLNSSKAQIISYFRDDMTTGLKVRNKSFADQTQIVFGISGETLKEQIENLKSEFKNSLPKDYQDYYYLLVVEI